MNLVEAFIDKVSPNPQREILLDEGRWWKYGKIYKCASALSRLIESADKSPEKNVGLLLPNSAGFIFSFFGILMAGRTVVPLNCLLKPAELSSFVKNSSMEVILTSHFFKPLIDAVNMNPEISLRPLYLEDVMQEIFQESSTPSTPKPTHEHDPACLIYTSGTVGKPKGVLLSHYNLLSNQDSSRRHLDVNQDDCLLCVLPFFHSFGMTTSLLLPLLTGARMVIMKSFHPVNVLDAVANQRITALLLVPGFIYILSEYGKIHKTDLSSVKFCVSGGGTLPPLLEENFPAIFNKRIDNGYGLTEASPVVSANKMHAYKKGTIGQAIPDVEISIWDETGNTLDVGEMGEIMVKGANVMKGYYKLPEETAKTIAPNGWLHTGDLGFLDSDGFLTITGRKKELIVSSGKNIFPEEVETVLMMHPMVEDAAVVGEIDPKRGEQVIAFIRAKSGENVNERMLRHHCATMLADYKIPRKFTFVHEIPRNFLGKVQRFLLTNL